MYRQWLLALVTLIMTQHVTAAVYKCQEGGRTTYRDQPCNGGSINDTITVKPNTIERVKPPQSAQPNQDAATPPAEKAAPEQPKSPQTSQRSSMPSDQALIAKCKANKGADCETNWGLARGRDKYEPQFVPYAQPKTRNQNQY